MECHTGAAAACCRHECSNFIHDAGRRPTHPTCCSNLPDAAQTEGQVRQLSLRLQAAEKGCQLAQKALSSTSEAVSEAAAQLRRANRDHSRASNKAQVAAEKAGSAVNDLAQEQLKLQQVQAARSAMPPISAAAPPLDTPVQPQTRSQSHGIRSSAKQRGWAHAAHILAAAEKDLEAERAAIDADVLQEDVRALVQLGEATKHLAQIQQQLERLQATQDELSRYRHQCFCAGLASINQQLAHVYDMLTGHQGAATCTFTDDPALLFLDGIVLNVRPDQHMWRPFNSLSGGQQALACLALSFAMQAAFPAPFFFYDEIDSALDVATAERVGAYLRNEASGSAQYLVVSHKPEVYEQASCLIGLHSLSGRSHAITVQFD